MHAVAITWNELEIHSVGRKYVDSTSVTSDHCTQLSNKIILHDFTTVATVSPKPSKITRGQCN